MTIGQFCLTIWRQRVTIKIVVHNYPNNTYLWDIPQLNSAKETYRIINEILGKVVNAIITVKFKKRSHGRIRKAVFTSKELKC